MNYRDSHKHANQSLSPYTEIWIKPTNLSMNWSWQYNKQKYKHKTENKTGSSYKILYQQPPGNMAIQVSLPDPSIWPRQQHQQDHAPHDGGNHHRKKASNDPNDRQDDSNPCITIHKVSRVGRPATRLPAWIFWSRHRWPRRSEARFEAVLPAPEKRTPLWSIHLLALSTTSHRQYH